MLPSDALFRAGVARALTRGDDRPVVAVVAAPGWGKSTLGAELLATTESAAWCRIDPTDRDPDALGSALRAAGVEGSAAPPLVILDDVHHLQGSDAGAALTATIDALAGRSRVVLLADRDPGVIDARHRALGWVLDIDARQLALRKEEISELLEIEQEPDAALAAQIAEVTGGWPAAVRMLLEALRGIPASDRRDRLATLCGPAGPVASYLLGVVVPALPPADRQLLTQLALLGDVTPEVLAVAAGTDQDTLTSRLVALEAGGYLRWDGQGVGVIPVVGHVLRAWDDPSGAGLDQFVDSVAARLVEAGHVAPALGVLVGADRPRAVADILEEHGAALLRAGEIRAIARAGATLAPALRTPTIERVVGQSLGCLGDWSPALACLEAAGAGEDGPLPAPLALALGLTHDLRGDLDAAMRAYRRYEGDAVDVDVDAAVLRAWRATCHWLRGELEESRADAEAALAAADRLADDHVRAHAHTARALVAASDGDRQANLDHYQQGLVAAQRAGDRLQEARIRTNLGSHHLEDGRYAEARRETDLAIDLATELGYAPILGLAWCNLAEIGLRTGRLDEAIADATTGRETYTRIGSRSESYAERLLGDARREQGELVLARIAYERAIRLASPTGDHQGLVPAYIGLAKILAATDPDRAAEVAERGLALDVGMARAPALLALAWVCIARDDADRARGLAQEALAVAEAREDRNSVAEAVTCLAVLDDDPATGLRRALVHWREVDAPLATARVELGLARRSDRPEERARVVVLEEQMLASGCAPDGGAFPHRLVSAAMVRPRTAIRVLGGFVVEQDGRPIARSAWGSRKARDLLKILVVRAGHRVRREQLADLLWPDEPYDEVSNRLSVALSVLRGVLSTTSAPAPVVAVEDAVELDTEAVEIDLVRFEQLAEEGERAVRHSDPHAAISALTAAEEAYGGDLLEDDLDATWVVDRRETLRSRYVGVARTLAGLVAADDPDHALRLLLRVLDRDGYDEPAHLEVCRILLRAGRHGEARRRHRLYEERMAELHLPAVSFASVAATPRARGSRPRMPRVAPT